MERLLRAAAVLCAVPLALSSCSSMGPACTEIGAQSGVSVSVAGGLATVTESLAVAVCLDDGCSTAEVDLQPGSSTTLETCTPDGVCSATATPDGTLVGFATVELPEEEVDADVTLRRSDGTTSVHTFTLTPTTVYPNGKRCGGGAVQGSLVLDDDVLRAG